MAGPYHFRPMTPADLPLVKQWLALPHVREWWGDPAEQYALVSGDLDEPAMDQFIVATDASDLGYIQCYDLTAWNSGFGAQPEGTRGIDLFIGEPNMMAGGHGSALIRAFVDDRLAQGAPRIVTDPDPANARAIRACEKAGFQKVGMVDTPDGPALLMARDA
ncbi:MULTISPECIES: GNAT family N-acetyltransferase [Bradyrhizobium]|uniref:Aminoglycoside 6'-N-acetyltransferase n=1 Tax=Bradyrhizobium elkanii TaxID=29448 RepID=A0A8I2BZ02_BRAEL|nr:MULTISPECIES: GNAT family N-acetyltransferase [Bradyrhizobium]MBP1292385.1 aminoglycoside 6'-N-acetyltransferase [Bradyrhizobium elkanii]MCP1927117.1 aminoglycoside 6'-N-acetyltransferase [Bradyrhizobium elkanii]MCP1974256.1 aminoglycoside 6'-N-acetyltransferase [Bradyrhizobium elkanii]MCS3475364.1 aminoglycoside 6'-N-acetyltransferase [Bradyrhizobium elkanii]MCS3521376.1 aminoglycoside 6'-N-acetyltransferase [Bradyrhizobium elkanii]